MTAQDLCVAIGVLHNVSESAFKSDDIVQTPAWTDCRKAIYHLQNLLEEVAGNERFGGHGTA